MDTVLLWVDVVNFRLFIEGKSFFGWNDRSTNEHVQIAVDKKKVKHFKEDGNNEIKIECE